MEKILLFILMISSLNLFSQEKSVNEKVFVQTESVPMYPGGISKFREFVFQNFDASIINTKGIVRCVATFLVSEKGYISNIEITGNNKLFNEESKRVLNMMKNKKWKPAIKNKKPVKYLYRFPITMNFE